MNFSIELSQRQLKRLSDLSFEMSKSLFVLTFPTVIIQDLWIRAVYTVFGLLLGLSMLYITLVIEKELEQYE